MYIVYSYLYLYIFLFIYNIIFFPKKTKTMNNKYSSQCVDSSDKVYLCNTYIIHVIINYVAT